MRRITGCPVPLRALGPARCESRSTIVRPPEPAERSPWIAREMAILLLTIPTLPQGKVIARMRAVVRPPHSTTRFFGILL